MRKHLSVALIALASAVAPAMAQEKSLQAWEPPPAEAESKLVGLPVYSSDNEKVGQVSQVWMRSGKQVVFAEMSGFLGIGPSATVEVPPAMYRQRADRVELTMPASQVRKILPKPQS